MSIYGEPKIEPQPIVETPIEISQPIKEPKPDYTNEINRINSEIEKIQRSGATHRRMEAALAPLRKKLNSLRDNENQIEY